MVINYKAPAEGAFVFLGNDFVASPPNGEKETQ